MTLKAHELIRRFLLHVLPNCFPHTPPHDLHDTGSGLRAHTWQEIVAVIWQALILADEESAAYNAPSRCQHLKTDQMCQVLAPTNWERPRMKDPDPEFLFVVVPNSWGLYPISRRFEAKLRWHYSDTSPPAARRGLLSVSDLQAPSACDTPWVPSSNLL